jgi:hypothetical protein
MGACRAPTVREWLGGLRSLAAGTRPRTPSRLGPPEPGSAASVPEMADEQMASSSTFATAPESLQPDLPAVLC